ncbi:GrpB family protein [Hymenobacter sp. 15J16-1T3B]|uniref:GrpB family protein n=1 Tax=Hymenobacter sp. 15J16-1T3B TaxID=2886941 RepID=UPI001D127AFC|nr:GrpB family protein [Hymenobacter sp. 15J16-1T3B]MCC3158451.1 GrpB family protein [Hymenobacter sp. 15J16-1T3B]
MPEFAPSRPVVLLPYQARWTAEYAAVAARLQAWAASAGARIEHIGSTAVPGLCAKDVIDVQLTVPDLDAAGLLQPLWQAGFRQGREWQYDQFHDLPAASPELRKLYLREPAGERRLHLHVREAGRFNARFALLFRDYLRAEPAARDEYALLKQRAAALFPTSIEGYLYLKEPVFHLIYQAATHWAALTGGQQPAEARQIAGPGKYQLRRLT